MPLFASEPIAIFETEDERDFWERIVAGAMACEGRTRAEAIEAGDMAVNARRARSKNLPAKDSYRG
ncbi:MAG TPA: hypothetical protein VGI39_04880 [Polyangiaceae bacterium]|jgi:hypothetical protein